MNCNKFLMVTIIFCLFSCKSVTKKENNQHDLQENNCLLTSLENAFMDYLKSGIEFMDCDNVYHFLYFFEKNSEKFFSIWTFYGYPNYLIDNNPNLNFNFYQYNIDSFMFVIIEFDSSIDKFIYESCVKEFNCYENKCDFIYDGSWYPKTYSYSIDEKDVKFRKTDTIYIDLLGEEFLHFEESLKK